MWNFLWDQLLTRPNPFTGLNFGKIEYKSFHVTNFFFRFCMYMFKIETMKIGKKMPNSVMCPALPSPLQSLHNQYWLAAMSGKGHGGWGRSNTWLRWFYFPKVFIINPIHFSLLLRFSQKHVWFDILGKVLIGNLVFRFTSSMSKSSLASTCSGCFILSTIVDKSDISVTRLSEMADLQFWWVSQWAKMISARDALS